MPKQPNTITVNSPNGTIMDLHSASPETMARMQKILASLNDRDYPELLNAVSADASKHGKTFEQFKKEISHSVQAWEGFVERNPEAMKKFTDKFGDIAETMADGITGPTGGKFRGAEEGMGRK